MTEKKTKGHWPAGKRRNTALPERQVRGLMRRVDAARKRRKLSITKTAAEFEVHERTLRRWLAGEDMPSAEGLVRVQLWLDAAQG